MFRPLHKQAVISDDYDNPRLGSGFNEGGGVRNEGDYDIVYPDQEYDVYALREPLENVTLTANCPQHVENEPDLQIGYIESPIYPQPYGNGNQVYIPNPDEQPPPHSEQPIKQFFGQRIEVS